jgi:hypothetical protein
VNFLGRAAKSANRHPNDRTNPEKLEIESQLIIEGPIAEGA